MSEAAKQINLFTKRANRAKESRAPESAVQGSFFNWLRLHESRFPELRFCFAVPNGGYRFKATAAAMKRTGTRAGVPDVFLPVPNAQFHGLWIEFKSDAGRLSDAQAAFMQFLETKGYKVLVCRSWACAADAVIDYLSLPVSKVKQSKVK